MHRRSTNIVFCLSLMIHFIFYFDFFVSLIRGGWIKASRSLFGSHFFIIHSNDLIFGYCGSIWLTIKHVKFDRRMWPPSSLTPSCLPPTNSAITQVLNTSMWCMSTCFEPHRASLKMSIVPAFGSSWFENYSIYKKCHVFFGTPCTIRGQGMC